MKKLVFFLTMLAGLGILLAVPSVDLYAATAKNEACKGIGASVGAGGCTDGSSKSIPEIVASVINIFSWIVGAVAILLAIYAGFLYITSGGEQGKIKTAKDTLIFVVVGLVIVALAQVIVQFVLKQANDVV